MTNEAERHEGKADRILKQCLYQIATGAWEPGRRLPSLREARERWSVNHLTVLRAYRGLEDLGLVRSVPRSGYFVSDNSSVDRLGLHRTRLRRQYESIRRRTVGSGLSALGTFRYFARIAEAEARDRPECAFVECTSFQAEMHSREVSGRLEIPCLSLTTGELAAGARVPPHVRTLLTTSFHHHEVVDLSPRRSVLAVPIELSADLVERLVGGAREVVVFATDAEVAKHAARDARRCMPRDGPRTRSRRAAADRIDALLDDSFRTPRRGEHGRAAVLSPTLWTALSAKGRRGRLVFPFEYRISEPAWPRIADAIGLPLGAASHR